MDSEINKIIHINVEAIKQEDLDQSNDLDPIGHDSSAPSDKPHCSEGHDKDVYVCMVPFVKRELDDSVNTEQIEEHKNELGNFEMVICEAVKLEEEEISVKEEPVSPHESDSAFPSDEDNKVDPASYLRVDVGDDGCDEEKEDERDCAKAQLRLKVIDGQSIYLCQHCEFQTKRRTSMLYHYNIHSGLRPFKCSICDYRSGQRGNLRRHLRKQHVPRVEKESPPEKTFRCLKCPFTSRWPSGVKKHVFDNHNTERPHQCDQCDSRFKHPRGLERHQRVHADSVQKDFKCPKCDYCFAYLSGLRKHMLIHDGLKPFKCSLCPYSSTQMSSVKTHMYIHTQKKPFCCTQCSYSTVRKSQLEKHSRKHSKNLRETHGKKRSKKHAKRKPRAYNCAHCEYSSTVKIELLEHLGGLFHPCVI